MKSIANYVAEWSSHGEMKVLKGVSLLMSVWVREWQHKDILKDWQKYVSEGEESHALETRHWPPKKVNRKGA